MYLFISYIDIFKILEKNTEYFLPQCYIYIYIEQNNWRSEGEKESWREREKEGERGRKREKEGERVPVPRFHYLVPQAVIAEPNTGQKPHLGNLFNSEVLED